MCILITSDGGVTPASRRHQEERCRPERRAVVSLLGIAFAVLLFSAATLAAQDAQNVLTVEVTENGFIFDGPSIWDATFESVKGVPLIVESFSVPGHAGALSRYNVHGLTGEDLKISAPGHEIKVVHTAGQTFIDVWLARTGSSSNLISSRYWMGPGVPSLNAATATTHRDNGDLYFASSMFPTGQIAIGRMDRSPVMTGETSPTGAAITSYKGKLVMAWQGTGNRLVNVMTSNDGITWTGKQTLHETSNLRPTLGVRGDQLVLGWIGDDHRINLLFSNDAVNFGGKQTLQDTSGDSCAILGVGDTLYIAWFGLGKTLNVASWNGSTFSKIGTPDTSDFAPTLSMLSGDVVVTWAGSKNLYINTMVVDTYHFGFRKKQTFALKSERTPTVISYRWTGGRDTTMALPLFIYSQGTQNLAVRYWSDIHASPTIEASGSVFPQYMVLTVVYAPPGTAGSWPKSTVEYAKNSQLGTSISITDSFKYDNKLSISAGFGPPTGPNASIGTGFGVSTMTQDQLTNDVKLSSSSSTKYAGPSMDGVNHDLDQIYLWLNPKVTFGLTAAGTLWSLGTKDDASALVQYVYVAWLKDPASMPEEVAGMLASHGITPDEYPKILGHDSFASNPTPWLDDQAGFQKRFQPTLTSFPYEPPALPGTTPPTLSYSQSTSSTVTTTKTTEDSYSVMLNFSAGFDFLGLFKASLKDDETWTWTSRSSIGKSSSESQIASLSITGPSFGYNGPTVYYVYWDSLYGAFVFMPQEIATATVPGSQKPGSTAAIVTGIVSDSRGAPVSLREVTLKDSQGNLRRTFTNSKGSFEFHEVPFGAGQLASSNVQMSITVGPAGSYYLLHI